MEVFSLFLIFFLENQCGFDKAGEYKKLFFDLKDRFVIDVMERAVCVKECPTNNSTKFTASDCLPNSNIKS